MTRETLQYFAKTLSLGDRVHLVYKAAPFNPMTGQPNVTGGSFIEAVGGALIYDDVSADGQALRACIDCEDVVALFAVGKVQIAAGRLS